MKWLRSTALSGQCCCSLHPRHCYHHHVLCQRCQILCLESSCSEALHANLYSDTPAGAEKALTSVIALFYTKHWAFITTSNDKSRTIPGHDGKVNLIPATPSTLKLCGCYNGCLDTLFLCLKEGQNHLFCYSKIYIY